jgi:hypothetical protein
MMTGFAMVFPANPARADVLIAHTGATDPVAEGFSPGPYLGVSTVAPLANDLGLRAWSITCPDNTFTQFHYTSSGLINSKEEIQTYLRKQQAVLVDGCIFKTVRPERNWR